MKRAKLTLKLRDKIYKHYKGLKDVSKLPLYDVAKHYGLDVDEVINIVKRAESAGGDDMSIL